MSLITTMPVSVAVAADTLVRSAPKTVIFIVRNTYFFVSKYPKNMSFNFENKITDASASMERGTLDIHAW